MFLEGISANGPDRLDRFADQHIISGDFFPEIAGKAGGRNTRDDFYLHISH